MTPPKAPFFPSRSRVLVGGLILVAALGLTWGKWYSTRETLQVLEWFEQNATPRDSVGYSNALYHATWAQAEQDNRWGLGGYFMTGTIVAVIGASLMWSARRRNAP